MSDDAVARARAAARSMSTPELIELHGKGRDGLAAGTWEVLDEELRRRHRERYDSMSSSPAEPTEVVVTDIRMAFWSMVFFMVKWSIASIPAFIILFALAAVLLFVSAGFFAAVFGGLPR